MAPYLEEGGGGKLGFERFLDGGGLCHFYPAATLGTFRYKYLAIWVGPYTWA